MFKNRENFDGSISLGGLDVSDTKNNSENTRKANDLDLVEKVKHITQQLKEQNRQKALKAEKEAVDAKIEELFSKIIISDNQNLDSKMENSAESNDINIIVEDEMDNTIIEKKPGKNKKNKDAKSIDLDGENFAEGDMVFYAPNSKKEREYKIKTINKNFISLEDPDTGITIPVNKNLIVEKQLISQEERFNEKERKKIWSEIKKIDGILNSCDLSLTKIKGVTLEENQALRYNKQQIRVIFNMIGFSNEIDKFVFEGNVPNQDIKNKIKELKTYIKSTEDIIAKYLKQ